MKKWNTPVVCELNIRETSSGWSHSNKEGSWVDDADHAHGVHGGGDKDKNPVTPDTLS